jgi:hypothetical protein
MKGHKQHEKIYDWAHVRRKSAASAFSFSSLYVPRNVQLLTIPESVEKKNRICLVISGNLNWVQPWTALHVSLQPFDTNYNSAAAELSTPAASQTLNLRITCDHLQHLDALSISAD